MEMNIFHRQLDRLLADPTDSLDLISSDPTQLVQELMDRAVRGKVSDLHFEPLEIGITVRFRLDGILKVVQEIPLRMRAEVLSRLKVMATLDIAEKRRPQDGRIRFQHMGQGIDIRVS